MGFTETEYGLENAPLADRHASTTVSDRAGETATKSSAGTATSHTQVLISDLPLPEGLRKSGCLRIPPNPNGRFAVSERKRRSEATLDLGPL
jgi:hypothetical protein